MTKKKSLVEVQKEKSERIMDGIAYWGAFYRENPQRFVKEFLNITLKAYQMILIYVMIHTNHLMYFASRGSGKTWLTALYCVVRCILYPGSKIIIVSKTKTQAMEVISKIKDDFMKNYGWGSQNLCREIRFISDSANTGTCEFYNGSWIHIVASNDNARHNRANIIIIDEFRMVPLEIIQTVIKRFLTVSRTPGYLNYKEYENMQERNSEIYMGSAWFTTHWCYEKAKAFLFNMMNDKSNYFICGLPYQLAIKSKLLMREEIEDEMSEEDFDPISFSMEMGCMFYGQGTNSFFDYEDFEVRRKIKNAFLPLFMYQKRGLHVPELGIHERRLMSVDVALMASSKHNNDATSIAINVAIPDDKKYKSNYVYLENFEGITTDELGITIMRYFYHYKCTDLVLDAQGIGLGVYDFIIKEQYDPETGETYDAMTCCNNTEMAMRCKVKNANKVVWCIKANADFNSNAAKSLRASLKNGDINLLVDSDAAKEILSKVSGYDSLTEREKTALLMPYAQTSMLITEAINLEHEITSDNKVKLIEKSNMRKDRYSSVSYNNAVVQLLNTELKPQTAEEKVIKKFKIKRASII